MNITEIKQNIQSKQFNDFYIFTGEEWQVQKIYMHKIAEVSGKQLKYIDTISDIYSNLKNGSFLSVPYTYIVRDDKSIMNDEKIQAQLDNGLLGDNILILLISSVDKRTKFYKKYKPIICDFERLETPILIKYVQKEIDLNKRDCERLINVCENDYSRILLEIDKIKRSGKTLDELLNDGTIAMPPYDAIFDFVDAVLLRKVNLAFDLLAQCYEIGGNTLALLSVLFNGAKQVLQVQACNDSNISEVTGLTTWQVKKAKEKCGNYYIGELVYMLKLIQRIEKGIKTGEIEEDNAMPYVLVNVL